MDNRLIFRQLFDHSSSTYTYILADPDTGDTIIIDPVLEQLERDCQLLQDLGLTLVYSATLITLPDQASYEKKQGVVLCLARGLSSNVPID